MVFRFKRLKVLSILSKILSELNSHQLQMERRGLRSTLLESFLSTFKFNSILIGIVLWGHKNHTPYLESWLSLQLEVPR